jgi:UV DNA damage endonuclease
MLLSFHPGPFTTIASPNESARLNGIAEVEMHAMACNLIDPDNCMDIPINYHVGGSYGSEFTSTAERFRRSFEQLSDRARSSTVIENDDKPNCWSVALLIEHIHDSCGVPITFDYHHHMIHSGGLSAQDAFDLARCTWGNRNMQCHYSQSPTDDKLIPAHSDYYRDPMPDFMAFAENCHIHLECKMKEQALIKYRDQFGVKS